MRNKVLFITLVLLITGCSQTPQKQAMPGSGMGGGGHMPMMTDVDSEEEFLVEMIPHHQEAVDTSRVVLQNTENEKLADLAERIIKAQEREITMMRGWLNKSYDGGGEASYTSMMPDLQSLKGERQDVAYLQGMIRHHMMAVMMSSQVLTLNPSDRVEEFARNVTEVQTSEIREMQQLLREYRSG